MEYIILGFSILGLTLIACLFFDLFGLLKLQLRINKDFLNIMELLGSENRKLKKEIEATDIGVGILFDQIKELNEKSNIKHSKKPTSK